jgi:hypothetical protein
MFISLALALIATASAAICTYLYDDDATLATRLCTGACVGLAALGLIGFVFASFLGLTPVAIIASTIVLGLPFALLRDSNRRRAIEADFSEASRTIRGTIVHPTRSTIGYVLYYAVAAVLLWRIFDRAMIELPDGISTGVINNFGDLPFHLSVITGFAQGNNFPPEDPTYAGVRFTYPFITDLVSAIFVRCGAQLRDAMFIENFLLGISLVALIHRWVLEMLRDRLAAMITPLLVLLNGGFGWVLLWNDAKQNEQGLIGVLKQLPHSYTIMGTSWRWGNALSCLLVPQRGILLGLPLAVIVFTQWWIAGEQGNRGTGEQENRGTGKREKGQTTHTHLNNSHESAAGFSPVPLFPFFPVTPSVRRMIAAGVVAGLLPLVHAHSFVVVMGVGACIALQQRRWREWFVFFMVASVIALPQIFWSTRNSAVNASSFFAWQLGWDRGEENAVWFWFKNTGLFIPLTVAAILWRGKEYLVSRRLLLFYLPFTLCFIVANSVKLAPWIWDNIKILYYWWLASAPLVALLLAHLWRQGRVPRALSVALFACLTLAGGLDVASFALRSPSYQIFDRQGVEFAEIVKQQTEPRALILHAPVHNDPLFLTGRRSFMGYPGHIWTHGLEFAQRESEIKRIYSGAPDAEDLIRRYGIQYAVVSPLEHALMPVNEQFLSRFTKVGEVDGYHLYKITP